MTYRIELSPSAASQLGKPDGSARRRVQAAVELLVARLRPADRATKAGPDDFLLYLPALKHDEAVAFAYGLVAVAFR